MTARRALAAAVWILTMALQAGVAIAITAGRFLDEMLAGQSVSPDSWAVGIAAVWGIMAVSMAYVTVGLLLAWPR